MNTRDEEQYVVLEVRPTGPTRRGRSAGDSRPRRHAERRVVLDARRGRRPARPGRGRRAPAADEARRARGRPRHRRAVRPRVRLGCRGRRSGREPVHRRAASTVAVLDTGIDATHEAFAGLMITQRDFTGDGDGDALRPRDALRRHDRRPRRRRLPLRRRARVSRNCSSGRCWATPAARPTRSCARCSGPSSPARTSCRCRSGIDFPGLVTRWTDEGLPLEPATSRALEGYRDNDPAVRPPGGRLPGRRALRARRARDRGQRATRAERAGDTPYTIGVSPPAASEGFVAVGAPRAGGGRRPSGSRSSRTPAPTWWRRASTSSSAPPGRRLPRLERDEHGRAARRRRRGAVGRERARLDRTARHRPADGAAHRKQRGARGGGRRRRRRGPRPRAPEDSEGGRMDWNFPPRPELELELPTGAGAEHDIPLGGSPFPPIAEYALLSDCEVCALVAPAGNVEWLSLPRMDGPSVFSAILDRHAGPLPRRAARPHRPRRPPLPAGNDDPRDDVGHADGVARGARPARWSDRGATTPRARNATSGRPRDHEAGHVLLRVLRCLDGFVDVEIECEPAFDYGRARGTWRHLDDAYGDAACEAGATPRRCACAPTCASGSRARARARETTHARRPVGLLRARLGRPRAARDRRRRRRPGSTRPAPTGTTGSAAAASPTTRGRSTCSAPRSRSRG